MSNLHSCEANSITHSMLPRGKQTSLMQKIFDLSASKHDPDAPGYGHECIMSYVLFDFEETA